jgi:hypothetical protein
MAEFGPKPEGLDAGRDGRRDDPDRRRFGRREVRLSVDGKGIQDIRRIFLPITERERIETNR